MLNIYLPGSMVTTVPAFSLQPKPPFVNEYASQKIAAHTALRLKLFDSCKSIDGQSDKDL
jgi:hypothetical protein